MSRLADGAGIGLTGGDVGRATARARTRHWALMAGPLAVALTLGACGDDDATTATTMTNPPTAASTASTGASASTSPTPDHDPSAVLRYATSFQGSGANGPALDPTKGLVPDTDLFYQLLAYDGLLHRRPDGSYEPGLATSATIVDSSTIDLDLREGVRFSDGTPFDAVAVKAGLERNKASTQKTQFRAELQQLASVDVIDPLTARLHLAKPVAGAFYPLLAGSETIVVSPTAAAAPGADLNRHPVGAGPFVLTSYEPDRKLVYERNPDHWDAAHLRIGGVEIVNVAGGPPRVNALRAGEVDLSAVDVSAADGLGDGFEVSSAIAESSLLWLPTCKANPPFDDERVRQALNLAIDRDAINDALLGGKGEPMWMLWPKGSRFYDPTLEGLYAYDPERASQLLADAGYAQGFATSIIISAQSPLTQRAAEILQAQWKAIGVDVAVVPSSNVVQDFYLDRKAPLLLNPSIRDGVAKLSGPYVPGSVGNACQYSDAGLTATIDRFAAADPASPEALEAALEAQRFIVEHALGIWLDYAPLTFAWSSAVSGVEIISSAAPYPDVWGITIDR